VKDENDDLCADYRNILNRWNNYSYQLLNVLVHGFRQTEIHTAEPLVSEHSFEVEISIEKVLIKFWHKQSKQEVKHYILRYTNLLIPF